VTYPRHLTVSGIKALLKKIEGYGITGTLLRWLENYISNQLSKEIGL
jgi:hypothetical protein